MKLLHGYYTYVGSTRKVNQDSILCRAVEGKKNSFLVIAVCDGVGGLEQGEVASRLICDCLDETVSDIVGWLNVETADADIIVSHMKDAVEESNQRLYDYRIRYGIQMGTTMSLLIILRDYYYIVQVGDSRVYLFRDGLLKQLTVDATVSAIRDGRMKSFLNNYMGKEQDVWYSVSEGSIQPEDLFIVCCDGFYHNLNPGDLLFDRKIFNSPDRANEKCRELVQLMMNRGDKDNITVGMAYVKK